MNVISADSPATGTRPKPVVLAILDGWGHRVETADNAIALARAPTWHRLWATCPRGLVETSGLDVGLPHGQMGNSEVGHMNIGAGRVMMQDLPRIDKAIEDGEIARNPSLNEFIGKIKATGGTVHLLGLVSPGGVHSHMNQIAALARIIDASGLPVAIHALLDGRDTPPSSGLGFMTEFQQRIAGLSRTRVATIGGRYYGMDRDKRWDRIEKAYAAMSDARAPIFADAETAIRASYEARLTDEFMLPVVIGEYHGMKDGDGILMTNFRADRARQILSALLSPSFDGFVRPRQIAFAAACGLTEYSSAHNKFMAAMFPAESGAHTLGQVVSEAGLKQLRIAETEKYAHVTFFLNGGLETEFPGEERILIPSPKVATYDLQPEMSAPEVTNRIVEAIDAGSFDLIIVNYANGDMVGHTGILAAAIKAAECIDACLARLETALRRSGGVMLICADHGNLELMKDPATNEPHTQHTVGVVPAVLVNAPANIERLRDGRLADIAPTILELMSLGKPSEMTGTSLLLRRADTHDPIALASRESF